MNLYKAAAMLIIFCLTLGILIIGKDFLIPIVIAVGAWFFFNAIAIFFTKISIKGKTPPLWLRYIFASITVGLFMFFIVQIVSSNIIKLQSQLGFYQENFKQLEIVFRAKFGLEDYVVVPSKLMERFNVNSIFSSLLDSLSSLVASTFLIILYLIFLLLEQHMFGDKIKQIFSSKTTSLVSQNIDKVKKSIESYILLKTLISLLTGVLSYIIMLIIGVDFALFWAFLIFLLNYIPNVGSLVATVFPALLSLVQFETIWPAVFVLFGIGSVQLIVGNFIEPKVFGKSLNLSALAVILSLTFWGTIWGLTGMFLCVPITVILMIVLNSFNETKPFAILLSDDGKI
jgi:predicted PurR-regulated permease PerM